ncbi:MAG: hypothetical protein JNL32_02965, partial [Candidatus Kapabacteria bacterium]|nr:hypothetical protein [Candidatus Kapabacteria bacterium]
MMALARNHIYYHDYTDERGNEYRLEMIPAECDAVGEPVMLPTTPTRTPFPDNIFLPSLTIRNEYADQKVLPIGLPQKNELVLKLKLPRTGYDDWYNLIALPVLYSNYKESPVFGVMPTRIFTRNTVFATLPKSYTEAGTGTVVTATYSIRSTSPDVALVVTEETTSGVTNFVFKVATGSPDAAFVIDSVTTFTYTNGTTLTWNNTGGYVIGAPAGYEYLTVPRTYRYGNVWRVWERTGSTVGTLRMEAMQRRVPPVKNVIATDGYTFDITAIDTVRCAMESTTVDECRAELPAAGKCQELISISSAATVVR